MAKILIYQHYYTFRLTVFSFIFLGYLTSLRANAQTPQALDMGKGGLLVAAKGVASGQWALYSMKGPKIGAVQIRLAAFERKGKAQWFEISMQKNTRERIVFRALVEGALDKPTRVRQLIVQPLGQLALILPEQKSAAQLPKLGSLPPKRASAKKTRLKIKAGQFNAIYSFDLQKGKKRQLWIRADAHQTWPLLKFISDSRKVELISYGKDARSDIVGTPVKLDPRLMR